MKKTNKYESPVINEIEIRLEGIVCDLSCVGTYEPGDSSDHCDGDNFPCFLKNL